MSSKFLVWTIAAASLAVAGCGGGDAPAPPVVTDSAEGVYTGTASNGLNHLSLVMDNGDFYIVYGKTTATAFGVTGFLRGTSVSGLRGFFGSTNLRDYSAAPSTAIYAFNGVYAAGTSLTGGLSDVTSTSTSATYTGTVLNDATYTYNQAASLANIAGAWSLADVKGAKVTLNVAADGRFTGGTGSCTVSGTLTPRASRKNVFDFALVYGAAPCAVPNLAVSGVAISYLIGTSRQFIAAGTDTTRANGTALFGTR